MQVGEAREIRMDEFFDLVESKGGTYEVETPQGWIEIGDLKREKKECYLLRFASGSSLGAGHDHLVETQTGWEKVEALDVENAVVSTKTGQDPVVAKEYIGERDTFDFEVLSPEHKYYANGVVSHNCGKTMSCKWLRQLCVNRNIDTEIVTLDKYKQAAGRGNVLGLFKSDRRRPKIVFFDDLDVMVRDRKDGNAEIGNFLTGLDGIETREGIVYVFTTNYIEELDDAFVRPGRIDLFVAFASPNETLRRAFVTKVFDDELKHIDVEELVKQTNEYSFAEIEEIRKLLCFQLLQGKAPNLEEALELFKKHREEFKERAQFGFNKMSKDDDDSGYYDDSPAPWES